MENGELGIVPETAAVVKTAKGFLASKEHRDYSKEHKKGLSLASKEHKDYTEIAKNSFCVLLRNLCVLLRLIVL